MEEAFIFSMWKERVVVIFFSYFFCFNFSRYSAVLLFSNVRVFFFIYGGNFLYESCSYENDIFVCFATEIGVFAGNIS